MAEMKPGKNYKATIVDQTIVKKKNNEQSLVLTCRVPELDNEEVKIWLSVEGQYVTKTYVVLASLGYEDSDLTKLHPDHKEFVDLFGKEVEVYGKENQDKTRVFWNLTQKQGVSLQEWQAFNKENKEILETSYKEATEPLNF